MTTKQAHEETKTAPQRTGPVVTSLQVAIPVCHPPSFPAGGFQAKRRFHVDAELDLRHPAALRHIFCALDRTGARLANGQPVHRQADVVRWMLEQIAKQIARCKDLPVSATTV